MSQIFFLLLMLFVHTPFTDTAYVLQASFAGTTYFAEEVQITVPDSWWKQSPDGTMLKLASGINDNGISTYLTVRKGNLESADYTPEKLRTAVAEEARNLLKDTVVLAAKDNWHILHFQISGVTQLQFFYICGATGYELGFTSSVNELDKNISLFREIEETFKLQCHN